MLLIENLSEKQLQDVRIECSYLLSFELARDDEFVIKFIIVIYVYMLNRGVKLRKMVSNLKSSIFNRK